MVEDQKLLSRAIRIVEYVNMGITVLFFFFYVFRLVSLRHFAVTDRYRNKYPKIRVVLCSLYFLISIPFLAISIVHGLQPKQKRQEFWVIEEGVGEFVDSIILIMQLFVLKAELSKERPYTCIHLIFGIYLSLISIARFVIELIRSSTYDTVSVVYLAFYLAFLVNSLLILGSWIAKRQELPEFMDNKYFSFEDFQASSSKSMINRNIEISYMRKISDNFRYIHPIVSVEKNKFRVVLEIYDRSEEDETEMMEDRAMSAEQPERKPRQQGLKVISNKLFYIGEIMELYKICGRFDIKQRVSFESGNLVETYKNLQNYLEELFAHKKHYLSIILQFFDVPQQLLERYASDLRTTLKGSEFDLYSHMDNDATIISVRVYKQLWIDDYYLFYMDVVSVDQTVESRPMKRYTDFQALHQKLSAAIKKKNIKFMIPDLPKKHLFNWDETRITQRRMELECYLRNICNDYKLMLEIKELRDIVFDFLQIPPKTKIQPDSYKAIELFKGTEVIKGKIGKQLTNNQYVTYYEFKLVKNGLPVRTFKKRYSDFEQLHEAIERYMHNTQVYYKFVVLPEKHMYKSGPIRQEKLRTYLNAILTIPEVWKIYQVVSFFHMDSGISDIDISGIATSRMSIFPLSPNMVDDSQNAEELRAKRLVDASSISSNQRMSALIDELGG